jgi:hypothetical protein
VGSEEWPDNDAYYAARNQALRCLYGGLVPLKSHECQFKVC